VTWQEEESLDRKENKKMPQKLAQYMDFDKASNKQINNGKTRSTAPQEHAALGLLQAPLGSEEHYNNNRVKTLPEVEWPTTTF